MRAKTCCFKELSIDCCAVGWNPPWGDVVRGERMVFEVTEMACAQSFFYGVNP